MVLIGDECFACWEFAGYQRKDDITCVEVCGDGILHNIDHDCDDSNTEDGDGCSSLCALEYGYECDGSTCREVIPPALLQLIVQEPNLIIIVFDEQVFAKRDGKTTLS